uniref:Uncharacterized protein n=1 Tax=Romanomermis culicivorax TaxID=13658 RepID=A0A915HPF5_ROMCU
MQNSILMMVVAFYLMGVTRSEIENSDLGRFPKENNEPIVNQMINDANDTFSISKNSTDDQEIWRPIRNVGSNFRRYDRFGRPTRNRSRNAEIINGLLQMTYIRNLSAIG